jgi:SLBB domain/LptA/(LptD N-terminal domain) LPS transport protein
MSNVSPNSSDAELLEQIMQIAHQIEPSPVFKAQLAAQLIQARPQARRGLNFRLRHPSVLIACASVTIGTVCLIPVMTSRQLSDWMSAAVGKKVNAQTLAQVMAERQISMTSDLVEEDSNTGNVKGKGNISFEYPDAGVKAKANEILFVKERQEFVLTGNVQLTQQGKALQGQKLICAIAQKQCSLTETSTDSRLLPSSVQVQVQVIGSVARPGRYKIEIPNTATDFVSLTQAIQTAGGVTKTADIRRVQIRRQNDDRKEQIISVNLFAALSSVGSRDIQINSRKVYNDQSRQIRSTDPSLDVKLQTGDIIEVPTAKP